jgi:acyl-coenzyme A synthetase/AMP-(fatty) acid ligase
MAGLAVISVVAAVACALAVRLGFHQRLALLLFNDLRVSRLADFAAERYGDRIIIELEEPLGWRVPGDDNDPRLWSARRVRDAAARVAAVIENVAALEQRGRAAIYKSNDFDIFLFSLAIIRAGGIAVPINGKLPPASLQNYLQHVGATVLFCDREALEALAREGVRLDSVRRIIVTDMPATEVAGYTDAVAPGATGHSLEALLEAVPGELPAVRHGVEDPLYLVHTSGTTGVPKAVILLDRGLTASLRAALVFNLVSRRDLAYFATPFNHQVTHLYLNGLLAFGGRAILSREFDPARTLRTIQERAVTVFFGFPIAYTQLAAEELTRHGLRSMRVWATTADASHEVHQRRLVRFGSFLTRLGIPVSGSVFVDGLGSSEVGIAALLRVIGPWTRTFGRRVGRPIPLFGPKVKVVDDNGEPVRGNAPGRLMIKGPCMFGGYWNAHDKLFAASSDGWWFTGDIVRKAGDGSYMHLDREVDVIHQATGASYTLPIEEEILKHPAVYDATVFAYRQDGRGPVAAAAVALKPAFAHIGDDQLRSELNRTLAQRDRLAIVRARPWSEFPIGLTGKTLKRAFRGGA